MDWRDADGCGQESPELERAREYVLTPEGQEEARVLAAEIEDD